MGRSGEGGGRAASGRESTGPPAEGKARATRSYFWHPFAMPTLAAIVLAAGQGTRMKSAIPKVLHPLAGRPLVYYAVRAALDAGASEVVVVVGHGGDAVTRYLGTAFGAQVTT